MRPRKNVPLHPCSGTIGGIEIKYDLSGPLAMAYRRGSCNWKGRDLPIYEAARTTQEREHVIAIFPPAQPRKFALIGCRTAAPGSCAGQ